MKNIAISISLLTLLSGCVSTGTELETPIKTDFYTFDITGTDEPYGKLLDCIYDLDGALRFNYQSSEKQRISVSYDTHRVDNSTVVANSQGDFVIMKTVNLKIKDNKLQMSFKRIMTNNGISVGNGFTYQEQITGNKVQANELYSCIIDSI